MLISPSKSLFTGNAESGRISPVYAEIPFMQPQNVFECLNSPYSFLLESIKGPEKIARYSFIGADPFLIFGVKAGEIEMKGRGPRVQGPGKAKAPLKRLRELLTSYNIMPGVDLPPFIGGAVGLISYDFVHYIEKIPCTAVDDLGIPDAHFVFVDSVIAIDHKLGRTFLISCPAASEVISGTELREVDWGVSYDKACEKITALYQKIRQPGSTALPERKNELPIKIHHEMGKEKYMDIVGKVKEYIKAGDIFQANLSQRVSAFIGDIAPWQVYKILSSINPSPFAAYLDMGDYQIASSSPERLVRVAGNTVETRPIAGTRPRGKNADGDRQMRVELLLNEKERAEHIMLIDLERNDLGKVSDYTTVKVDEFMITEEYSHVIHIVSNITGQLAQGRDCFDAIRATFPGGTITGVPKVRCMEIIDELEPVTRGPYTGSIGYISFTGDMDMNIVIRTFVIKNGTAYVQAGAGIVADSDPEREYYETLKKAEALIRTLETL